MRRIIIVAIITVIVSVSLILFLSYKKGGVPVSPPPETLPFPTIVPRAAPSLPAGDILQIGTPAGSVAVKNFYKNPAFTSADNSEVVIKDTATYNIGYSVPDSSFGVWIASTPFDTVRAEAEDAFLKVLGITRAEACKLNVREGTSVDVDPERAGTNFGLSFCPKGLPF